MTNLPPNFYLINKPVNWTSFDVVGYIRKIARASARGESALSGKKSKIKVGHAGTLDPFATGLLIVGVGRDATRAIDQFKNLPKTYRATVFLGATSTTGDPTGDIKYSILNIQYPIPEEIISKTVQTFLGSQTQVPPMYSAKSIGGVRLYKLARADKTVDRQPNNIEILDIKILGYSYPELVVEVTCSPGTYIRTLAEDIGKALGTGAYCQTLERTAIGDYKLADAVLPSALYI